MPPPPKQRNVGEVVVTIRPTHGCYDCPFLEVYPFNEVHCPYTVLPKDVVIDPHDLQLPPYGCPLLNGGTVIVLLAEEESK